MFHKSNKGVLVLMQLMLTHTPKLVTRAVVMGMCNAVCTSLNCLYSNISKDDVLEEYEHKVSGLFIRTDIELLGAILFDMSEANIDKKMVCVCLGHLHDSLHSINDSLRRMDEQFRSRRYIPWRWTLSSTTLSDAFAIVQRDKTVLDHHIERFIQIQQIKY